MLPLNPGIAPKDPITPPTIPPIRPIWLVAAPKGMVAISIADMNTAENAPTMPISKIDWGLNSVFLAVMVVSIVLIAVKASFLELHRSA